MIATYFPLLPLLILVTAGMLIMLLEPFTAPGRKSRLGQMAVVATALAAYSLAFQWNSPPRALFRGMFVVDNFSVFFQWLFLVITGISALVSIRFNERESIARGE
jgi:NADH-quinone oxidoreductase subunit N